MYEAMLVLFHHGNKLLHMNAQQICLNNNRAFYAGVAL